MTSIVLLPPPSRGTVIALLNFPSVPTEAVSMVLSSTLKVMASEAANPLPVTVMLSPTCVLLGLRETELRIVNPTFAWPLIVICLVPLGFSGK